MEEIWKTLKYHDQVYNRYEVSTFGNIRHKINNLSGKKKNIKEFKDAFQ